MAKIKSSIPRLELCTAVTGAQLDEDEDLTDPYAWSYVNSARNADDGITRERTFKELAELNRLSQGSSFLFHDQDSWPVKTFSNPEEKILKNSGNLTS